ncbi:hypothetical protein BAE44_0017911 [Dichanthelium oligosanthes]|uniref:Uncharacterized protein n=1 Tax=Dichanthelium oligosanthes TaxID=888268 RepID=A0A1E5V7D8_9POAL|nr:hypothetical protein BAE44_0017911 [Dichanthelium oligosanthes]
MPSPRSASPVASPRRAPSGPPRVAHLSAFRQRVPIRWRRRWRRPSRGRGYDGDLARVSAGDPARVGRQGAVGAGDLACVGAGDPARSTSESSNHGARAGLSNGIPLLPPREDLRSGYRWRRSHWQGGPGRRLHLPIPPKLLRLVLLHVVGLSLPRLALGGCLGVAGLHVLVLVCR